MAFRSCEGEKPFSIQSRSILAIILGRAEDDLLQAYLAQYDHFPRTPVPGIATCGQSRPVRVVVDGPGTWMIAEVANFVDKNL